MSDILNEFLDNEPESTSRCSICANAEMAEMVEAHLDLLQKGQTTITMHRVYDGLLFPMYGQPKSFDTIRRHVKSCLRRSIRTGGNLR